MCECDVAFLYNGIVAFLQIASIIMNLIDWCTSEQSWNAFEDSTVNLSLASFENLPQKSEPKIPAYYTPTFGDHFESSKVLMVPLWIILSKWESFFNAIFPNSSARPQDFSEVGFQRSTIEESAPSLPFNDVIAGSPFPSELPSMVSSLF